MSQAHTPTATNSPKKSKMPSRRAFLRLAGGGTVLAATAIGLSQCDSMPREAIAGWKGPDSQLTDPRKIALSYALLAPNPHNLQSWLVDLRQDNSILLSVDQNRLLPETDPFGRQVMIGQGTFLELLIMALKEQGIASDLTLFPEGHYENSAIGTKPWAKITLQAGQAGVRRDPLFKAVLDRRSTKEPYDMDRPMTAVNAQALKSAHVSDNSKLTLVDKGPLTAELRRLTKAAALKEHHTPAKLMESLKLSRIGADEIAKHRDGIDLHGPFFWWAKTLGMMSIEDAATPGTAGYQAGIDYAAGWADATPSFGWLTTADNSRETQIETGRAFVRLNLAATSVGLAFHPVSQVLQEYEEMAELQREFLEITNTPEGSTVQMLFRLGYADKVPPSPRRDLNDLLV
ncbi:Acg family FMN-binding oxidoreductase [Rhodovibrionaceae bacterium A322]